MRWIRTCQECNYKQPDSPPPENLATYERRAEHKCKRCKSISLNYGKAATTNDPKENEKEQ